MLKAFWKRLESVKKASEAHRKLKLQVVILLPFLWTDTLALKRAARGWMWKKVSSLLIARSKREIFPCHLWSSLLCPLNNVVNCQMKMETGQFKRWKKMDGTKENLAFLLARPQKVSELGKYLHPKSHLNSMEFEKGLVLSISQFERDSFKWNRLTISTASQDWHVLNTTTVYKTLLLNK